MGTVKTHMLESAADASTTKSNPHRCQDEAAGRDGPICRLPLHGRRSWARCSIRSTRLGSMSFFASKTMDYSVNASGADPNARHKALPDGGAADNNHRTEESSSALAV